jgi:hypothetical protein
MTVCCRSNDAIWGAHGANAVHFSVLLEYLAARIGLQVGTLVQVSNNYHAYEAFIQVMQARARKLGFTAFTEAMYDDRYAMAEVRSQPMFSDPGHVDEDVGKFMRWMVETTDRVVTDSPIYKNSWFAATLEPMMRAYWMHRLGRSVDANRWAREVEAQDWSLAAVEWLQRRSREGDKRSDDAVQSTGSASEAVPHVADADRPVGR